jgi:tyrosine aminotransferase
MLLKRELNSILIIYQKRHLSSFHKKKILKFLQDVILSSGCSHALDLCMTVLAFPGSNILVPRPGFPLYRTLSAIIGIEIRYYNLLPNKNWEIDLNDLDSQLDSNTVAIIYNNPSNPCGSVFNKEHIIDFLAVAEKNFVPIIADEIYEDLVFPGHHFYPIASLTTEVPVLACGGTTKKSVISYSNNLLFL